LFYSPWQTVQNGIQLSLLSSVWSWREGCQCHSNFTPPDAVSLSSICRRLSFTTSLCSTLYSCLHSSHLSLSTSYLSITLHSRLVVLSPFPPRPSSGLPTCSRCLAPASVSQPNQATLGKEGWCISSINAPCHQTSTSPPIHRQQTSTLNRQPRDNSSIFRSINIRHGWRQGKIIWRQVVRRQGRSRWFKEAAEPF
jgi:hypothetical protein